MTTAPAATVPATELADQDPPYGLVPMNLREFVGSLPIGFGLMGFYSAGGGPQGLRQAAIGYGVGMALSANLPFTKEAHGNPDVSTALAVRNRSLRQLTHRVPGQLVAWTLLPFIGVLIYWTNVPRVNYGVATPPPSTPVWQTFVVQLLAVGAFAALMVFLTGTKSGKAVKLGWLIGAVALGVLVYFTASTGGGGINAARELGPALHSWADPVTTADIILFWAAFIGGRLGAVLAGLALRKVPSGS